MQFGWPLSDLWRDPWALSTGLPARLAASCGVVALIWALVAWAW